MFREMRRHGQRLEAAECESILHEGRRGVLSLAGDGGYPYGIPINYLYRDGRVYFHGARSGHKVDAIASCDKACLTVLDEGVRNEGEWWWCFRSVICFGRIRPVTDKREVVDALQALGDKYFPEGYDIQSDIDRNLGRVRVLELAVEHMSGKFVREK